ncbi:MAG: hypothetical protein ACFFER_03500 [Candidatus Thorarchaeota archaeon]
MKNVIEILKKTQADCKKYGAWLTINAPRVEDLFVMLHNHAMSTQEILDCIGTLIVKTKKEANQRVMLIIRSNWIFSLSIVEYSIKRIIRQSKSGPLVEWYLGLADNKHVRGAKRGFSLRTVMKQSHKAMMIDDEQSQSWASLQDMRNSIIHNNGFVEESKTFRIGNVAKEIGVGERIQYSHLDGAYFIQLIPTMTQNWIEKYLEYHTV